jgi:hypothetical protein
MLDVSLRILKVQYVVGMIQTITPPVGAQGVLDILLSQIEKCGQIPHG